VRVSLNNGRATLPTRRNVMTTRYEQDLDTQLSEMFAVHKDYFDRKEREVEGRRKMNLLSTRLTPPNREKVIGEFCENYAREIDLAQSRLSDLFGGE